MPQLCVLGRRIIYFFGLEVVLIAVVVGSVPPDAASLDSVVKLENLALEIYKLFLERYNSLYYVISVKFVLYYNIR